MIIEKPDFISKHAVGCIMTYNSKFLMTHRVKDCLWSSLAGGVEEGETPKEAVVRELNEELGLNINPSYFETTYHKYGDEIIAYHIFEYKFEDNPFKEIKLNRSENTEIKLFSFKEALELDLYEDEDYCLELFHKKRK